MTKFEEYSGKAAESLAALEAATTERDRMFHRRAHSIWRRLMAGIGEAEERAATQPPRPPKSERAAAAASRRGASLSGLSGR